MAYKLFIIRTSNFLAQAEENKARIRVYTLEMKYM